MDENAREAEDASPFRRFPWVQLVFCLACLGTSGLVAVSYSTTWDTTIAEVRSTPIDANPWIGRYVRLHTPNERWGWMRGHHWPQEPGHYGLLDRNGIGKEWSPETIMFIRASRDPDDHEPLYELEDRMADDGYLEGRIKIDPDRIAWPLWLDTTASRFHPASIAGLVVGAMGCFIFGLYLRRWLAARRAALTTKAH